MGSKALVSTTFKKKLTSLELLRSQITRGHFELASAYINFAEQFISLLDEAKQEDKANDTKTHQDAVLKLGTLDGSQLTPSTVSKWRKIADESRELKRNQRHLPSSRDALYFIALGVEKGVKIGALASRGELSAESTLTEIKKLLPSVKGASKKQPSTYPNATTINMGADITACSAVSLGIDAHQLPPAAQKILNNGYVLLRVKADIDPDTNSQTLVAIGYGK